MAMGTKICFKQCTNMTWIIWYFLQYFLFLLFSSYIIFYRIFIILSHILSWKVVILSLSLSLSLNFLLFLITLLYIDELLWFLKLYFRFICLGVIFFSSLLQIVLSLSLSFSLIVLVGLILFELALDYFGSNNLSL